MICKNVLSVETTPSYSGHKNKITESEVILCDGPSKHKQYYLN